MTTTHTYALLEVLPSTYDDIRQRLEQAGYDHAFDGDEINMHGIGLIPVRPRPASIGDSIDPRGLRADEALTCLESAGPEKQAVLTAHLDTLRDDVLAGKGIKTTPAELITDARTRLGVRLPSVEGSTTLKSYRHYNGGTYTLLMVARSSEARDELFAVYVSHQTQQVWVRPWAMFNELVVWTDGVRRPRFIEMTDDEPASR